MKLCELLTLEERSEWKSLTGLVDDAFPGRNSVGRRLFLETGEGLSKRRRTLAEFRWAARLHKLNQIDGFMGNTRQLHEFYKLGIRSVWDLLVWAPSDKAYAELLAKRSIALQNLSIELLKTLLVLPHAELVRTVFPKTELVVFPSVLIEQEDIFREQVEEIIAMFPVEHARFLARFFGLCEGRRVSMKDMVTRFPDQYPNLPAVYSLEEASFKILHFRKYEDMFRQLL